MFLFFVTAVAACSRKQDDAEDTTDSSAPAATLAPTATPVPTKTPAPTPVATTAAVQSAMPGDSYAEMFCGYAGSEEEEIESMTFGQLSAELTGSIELLEAMGPPQEYAGWHEALLSFQRAQLM